MKSLLPISPLRFRFERGIYVVLAFLIFAGLVWLIYSPIPQSTAAPQRPRVPTFVRGYIAVAIGGTRDATGAVRRARDLFIPGVTVFLRDLSNNGDGPPATTDLSGRFTLRPHNLDSGRYLVCWKGDGFVPGCGKEISVSSGPVHLSTVRIQVERSADTTVVHGKVKMKDGSRPRWLDPLASVNAFARVSLLDRSGGTMQKVYVNNFDEYLVPRVPVRQELSIRAEIEGARIDHHILPQANLEKAPFHPLDLVIANTPPRVEELVPMNSTGRRIKVAQPGTTVNLKVRALDPEGDPLQFKWIVSGGSGSLSATNLPDVRWTLPSTPGLYSVKVLAWDKKGGYASAENSLRVNRQGIPFSGKVDATDASFVAGAEVEVNGRKTFTGREGFFKIHVADATRFVLNIRKPGYGLVSRIYDDAVTGGTWTMTRATTMRLDPKVPMAIVDKRDRRNCPGPKANTLDWRKYAKILQPQWQDGKGNVVHPYGKLEVPLPQYRDGQGECGPGVQVEIPANALRDEKGKAPTGPVDVSVSTIDLMSPGQMPGDFTVRQPSGGTRVMQSYGAASIEITAGGKRFNLRTGTKAKITLPVDKSQLAAGGTLPATIPILFYNERDGVWVEEGTATLSGNVYVANVRHFSTINTDLVKTNQSCVRVKSPTLPPTYKIEYSVPMGGGAAPVVRLEDIDNSSPSEHALYNLPSNTNMVIVPIRSDTNIPFGTFVVNTGGPQSPTTPNRPVGPPYSACSTEVILTDLGIPEEPTSGEFLHGLYSFAATNITELDLSDPTQAALAAALEAATEDYYEEIDPRGKRTTLADFKTTNGFPTGEIVAKFANSGDLGFGRDMHCTKKANADMGGFDVACYVTNYGSIETPDAADVLDTVAGTDPVATVAMEFSQIESDPPNPDEYDDDVRVVKFYVYNGDGTALENSANLDAKGKRPIPQLCMVCHNGEYPGGPVGSGVPAFANREDVKLGSRFLPFDLHYYTFAPAPHDKATQQAAFKSLNEDIVKNTPPDATYIADIVTQMYALGPTQNENFVVTGWNATPIERGMYKDVIGRTCRTCHAANLFTSLQFDQSQQAKDILGAIESRTCTEHVMPHAKVPHELFWTSVGPHMPAQLQIFGDTFQTGLNGWNGTLCGSFTPGGSTPVSFYTSTIQPIFNGVGTGASACTSCHFGASPPAGLNLTAGNSYPNIFNVFSTELPSMRRVSPGNAAQSYLFHKIEGTQGSVGGSGSQMPPSGLMNAASRTTIQNWIISGAPGP